jgi:glycosyltransferase involved in cell wall biosynthesis
MLKTRSDGKLLVIHGGTVNKIDSKFYTKNPIAEYLNELGCYFNGCTWLTFSHRGEEYKGEIDSSLVNVVIVERNFIGRMIALWKIFYICLNHDYVLYFLPNPYFVIFPWIRIFCKRIAVYLAGDYKKNILELSNKKYLGWSFFYRVSFEYPMKNSNVVISRGERLFKLAKIKNANVFMTIPLGHMSCHYSTHENSFNESTKKISLLFVGKILHTKGVGWLIESFLILKKRYPDRNLILDIVGDGSDLGFYKDFVRSSKNESFIKFHGWVSSGSSIDKFYNQANVLIVPSISPEGVPRVIDEAILRNLPVIATKVGGIIDEFTCEEILLINNNEKNELVDAIESILFSPSVRKFYLNNAKLRKNILENFSSAASQHAEIILME